jgi:glc operon protein GlcG
MASTAVDSLFTIAPILTSAGASATISAAEGEAKRNGWRVCIAVVDAAGRLLAFQRMDGAPPISIELSIGKAKTAVELGAATKLLQDRIDGGQPSLLAARKVMPLQGGVPIIIQGRVAGGIGVSGAKSHEDVAVAEAAAAAVLALLK